MDVENIAPSNVSGSIEQTYQKKTQLEHILLRPDTYIGSVEPETTKTWVFDEIEEKMEFREITFVPGLYKIFDEILVNAADNKQRDSKMDALKVDIDAETGTISVYNNGRGIPVQIHSEYKVYVPELIFGHLLTSSNYNDKQKKTTGGRNGYGAKLTNIYSTEFIVETADKKKKFKQIFSNNMGTKGKPKVTTCKTEWTKITFTPDYQRFGMPGLTNDVISLLKKRVYDMAGCLGKGVKCYLNGKQIKIKSFKDYVKMYVKGVDNDRQFVYEKFGPRWEVAVSMTDGHFQQISFVNSINTMKGGQHVNHVTDQVSKKMLALVKKKHKGLSVKPHHIKNHLWIFVNCLIENPAFDSQTKLNLTTVKSKFGSKCPISDKFVSSALNCGILEHVLSFARFKQSKELKKTDGKRSGRITGIPKLSDANNAGSKKGSECTLILTEGDSAKALALSGISVVGRDNYGVFPLKGKLLNVRDAKHSQIMANKEVTQVKKILGLQQGKEYKDTKSLRYGRVMIMADQDHDGSHIKGLVINMFSYFWPSLFTMPGFLVEFITPIVKCTKGKKSIQFFTLPEYESWKEENNGGKGWKIKYYKGLGTSTPKEAKEYFSDLDRHVIEFEHQGDDDTEAIMMAFSKKSADKRKEWLQEFKIGTFLAQNNVEYLRYKDFVNKELILFSMESNARAIPSLVDGLKPGQRKILFSCFKRNLTKEIKVAQLAGYVSEHSAYHHGEASLTSTIVNMAQNYVGSNNINFLLPNGQFGTRYEGGKDAASPRYIFTSLSPVTRTMFCPSDDNVLEYLNEDGQWVEPQYYVPILPSVLVNGASGIGTGWSTNIPNYNPREICENLKRMMRGEDPLEMKPWYKGFIGSIERNRTSNFSVAGLIERINDTTLKITELPICVWTLNYKIFLEELLKTEKIKNFRENHTDNTVSFTIIMPEEKLRAAEKVGLRKYFKLSGSVAVSNLVLFSSTGQLKKYNDVLDILQEFYDIRMDFYGKRKDYLVETLSNTVAKLQNKARFIKAVIDGDLVIQRKKKAEIIDQLIEMEFRAFPKNAPKNSIQGENEEESEDDEKSVAQSGGYDYLLGMQLWSLTYEKIEKLEQELSEKSEELENLEATTIKELWRNDIDEFLDALDEHEEKERLEEKNLPKKKKSGNKKRGKKLTSRKFVAPTSKPTRKQQERKTVKKIVSLVESDISDIEDDFEDSGSDYEPTPIRKKTRKPAKKREKKEALVSALNALSLEDKAADIDDDEESDFVPSVPKLKKGGRTKKETKKKAPSKKAAKSKSAPAPVDEFDFETEKPEEAKTKKGRKPLKTLKAKKSTKSSSLESKRAKNTKRSKPKKVVQSGSSPSVTPKPKRRRRVTKKAKSPVPEDLDILEEDEESEEEVEEKKTYGSRRTRRQVPAVNYAVFGSDDDAPEEESEAEIEDESDYEDY